MGVARGDFLGAVVRGPKAGQGRPWAGQRCQAEEEGLAVLVAVNLGCAESLSPESGRALSRESVGGMDVIYNTDWWPVQEGGQALPQAPQTQLQPGVHATPTLHHDGLTPALGFLPSSLGAAGEQSPRGSISPTACQPCLLPPGPVCLGWGWG